MILTQLPKRMASERKTYTREELETHSNEESTWVAIHGKVYDVTKWKKEHPGGPHILLENAGADCTELFEHAQHSSDARELMGEFCIGELEHEPVESSADVSEFHRHNTTEETGFLMLYGLPLLAVIIAYIFIEYFLISL